MLNNGYDIKVSKKRQLFAFNSVGTKGIITKIVQYYEVESNLFNLGFGDLIGGEVNDLIISNNGDGKKVLVTVIKTLDIFLKNHPSASVVIVGSDSRRTRLYNWIIDRYFDELKEIYDLKGIINDNLVDFQRGLKYSSFQIKLKMS